MNTSAVTGANSPHTEVEAAQPSGSAGQARWGATEMRNLDALIPALELAGHGVIMTAGMGGSGKTTAAAAIAVILAQRGHLVHLVLSKAAAEPALALDEKAERLTLANIDPATETAAFRAEVLCTQGGDLNQAGRAMLETDLLSSCTEEIAVFRAYAREANGRSEQFVVLDTAPTGHTLLLLDAGANYQREMERQAQSTQPAEVLHLLARMRDPAFTRVIVVTLAGEAAVLAAAAVQEDLRRAQVEPFGWIINQSRLGSGLCDPLLRQRAAAEQRYVCEVVEKHATRTAWLPWQPEAPVGPEALARLGSARLHISGAGK